MADELPTGSVTSPAGTPAGQNMNAIPPVGSPDRLLAMVAQMGVNTDPANQIPSPPAAYASPETAGQSASPTQTGQNQFPVPNESTLPGQTPGSSSENSSSAPPDGE